MSQGTGSFLTWAAIDIQLKMNRIGIKCLTPLNICRAKNRDHGDFESRGKMSWPRIRVLQHNRCEVNIHIGDLKQTTPYFGCLLISPHDLRITFHPQLLICINKSFMSPPSFCSIYENNNVTTHSYPCAA